MAIKSKPASFFHIILLLSLFSLIFTQNTILSYLSDYEEEDRQDFLEMTISVYSSQPSLQQAIAEAKQKAQQIKTLEQQICRELAKSKSQCKGSAEIGKVQIEPKYEQKEKRVVFSKITASYDVLVKVSNPEIFGDLVDRIINMEGFVISKIQWQPDEDKIENTFLTDNLEKAKVLCKQLGLSFKQLLSVEELREEPEEVEEPEPVEQGEEEEQQEQQPEEEQPEEEENVTTYRITIECTEKAKKKEVKKK